MSNVSEWKLSSSLELLDQYKLQLYFVWKTFSRTSGPEVTPINLTLNLDFIRSRQYYKHGEFFLMLSTFSLSKFCFQANFLCFEDCNWSKTFLGHINTSKSLLWDFQSTSLTISFKIIHFHVRQFKIMQNHGEFSQLFTQFEHSTNSFQNRKLFSF